MSRANARVKVAGLATAAFVGGVIVAAGFNLTPFGYAQSGTVVAQKPSAQAVQPMVDASNAFVSIAEHVTPGVVQITTERKARATSPLRRRGQQQAPPGMEDFFRQFEQQPPQGPVEGSGSGFIVSRDGYILTNNHVVENADVVNVALLDKRVFKAQVIGRDPTTDVAVIKIEGTGFPTVALGMDETTRVGEWVLAIGNPLGLDFTVTAGIVSAKGRSGDLKALYASNYAIVDYIQTDAAINPGNSGGPLVNIRGEVIGINSAIASPTGVNAGYGFAIPITLAKSVMNDLIKYGKVRRAVIGVTITEVHPEDAQAAHLKEIRGALVGGYNPPDGSSPAQKAGIEPGDIIVAVDSKPIDRVATMQRIIRDHKPGDVVDIDVNRFGTPKSFKVKLGEAPNDEQVAAAMDERAAPARPSSFDKLGVDVQQVTPELARQADLTEAQRGLIIKDVDTNGPAFRRLFRGQIILEVLAPGQRRTIRTPADFDQALDQLKSGDVISLLVFTPEVQPKSTSVVNIRIEK